MTGRFAVAGRSRGRVFDRLRAWLMGRGIKKDERIAARNLEELSDHLLRDMGLNRDGIRHAVRHGR